MPIKNFLLNILNEVVKGGRVCPNCGTDMNYIDDEDGIWECPECFREVTEEAFRNGFIFTDEEEAELAGYNYDNVYDEEMERRQQENPTGEYYDPEIDE